MLRIKTTHTPYYVYIVTNERRTILDVNTTGDLAGRVAALHSLVFNKTASQGADHCHVLVYWESFNDIQDALKRERELLKLPTRKRRSFILQHNPELKPLNNVILPDNEPFTL